MVADDKPLSVWQEKEMPYDLTKADPKLPTFKLTEVGLIPSDWEVKKLGELGRFSKGQGVRKDEALSGEIPCVRYGELYTRHSDYVKRFYSFISKKLSENG